MATTDYDNWVRDNLSGLIYPTRLEGWMNKYIEANRTVEARLTTAEADIDTNTSNISSNDTDISNLQTDVTTLEGLHNRPYVYAAHSTGGTAQTFTTGATSWFTNFNTGGSGAGATHTIASGRLLIGSQDGGIWFAIAGIIWDSNSSNQRNMYIAKNQSLASGIAGNRFHQKEDAASSGGTLQQVSGMFSMTGEDSFDIAGNQNSGGNLNVTANASRFTYIIAWKMFD